MNDQKRLLQAVQALATKSEINKQRELFFQISSHILKLVQTFSLETTLYKGTCSMAFNNRGAFWLQDKKEIANPYFGKIMPKCGEIKQLNPSSKK